jgi:DNA mismatch repair protein MutS2
VDRIALDRLEFERVTADIARRAESTAGAERLRAWRPIAEHEALRQEIELLKEALARTREPGPWLGIHTEPLDDLLDPERRELETFDLLRVRGWLDASRDTREAWNDEATNERHPRLAARVQSLPDLDPLRAELHRALEADGRVADAASPALARARAGLAAGERDTQSRLERWARGFGEDAYVTRHADRFVALVPAASFSRRRGIVHDVSGSGQSLFVEPVEFTEANNQLIELRATVTDEERRIVRALGEEVIAAREELSATHETLVHLDTLRARARWAAELNAIVIAPGGERLRLVATRHPLLAAAGVAVVPLDLELASDASILLVTGPNMGGKTVLLKSVGLAAAMTHAALPVVAGEGSAMPELDELLVDLGDAQSLDQGLSTFAAHLRTLDAMARRAGPRALLLCDELGAGTDPEEGGPLGRSLIERFAERRAWGVITTHLGSLKLLAGVVPRVVNGSLEIDATAMAPTFRFIPGVPGASHALSMAERLGLDPELIAKARATVREESATLERVLNDLQALRLKLDQEREALTIAQQAAAEAEQTHRDRSRSLAEEMDRTTRRLTSESEALVARARELWQTVQREAKRADKSRAAAADLHHSLRDVERGIDTLSAAAEQARAAHGVVRPAEAAPLAREEIAPGLKVRVGSLGMEAEVLAAPDRDGQVQLRRGAWTLKVRLDDLVRLPSGERADAQRPRAPESSAAWESDEAPLDVDLRGKEVDEAIGSLDHALDRAVLAGMQELKIIHGIGKGVLRSAVERHLRGHPQVASVRVAGVGEGGRGVTLARLR